MRFNPPREWIQPKGMNTHFFGFVHFLKWIGYRENYLEIGTHKGEGISLVAASGFFENISTIDVWNHGRIDILEHFDNITYYIGSSDDCIDDFEDGSLDVVYIDGDHSYEQVSKDIQNYLPKLKDNGFMAGHDYHEDAWPEVVRAVKEQVGEPDEVFMDTTWVKRISK